MAIDPTTTTTVKVGELASAGFNASDLVPHEVGGILKKGTLGDLATFIGGQISATSGVGFRAVQVTDGQTLPATTEQEFILVGPGTYPNVGGGATITLTEELNALVSNGTYWFVGVEIPIQSPDGAFEPAISTGTTSQYWRGDKTWQDLNKSVVGLANVDNTSDANKPISTATQTALDNTVKLTGVQNITGSKTFTTVSGNAITVTNPTVGWGQVINNTSTGVGLLINNDSTGKALTFLSTGTSTGDIISHQGIDGLIKFKLTSVGDVTANSFIKSGGTSGQFLMADGSVSSGSAGSLEFDATDLTVWNNGKGNVTSNTSFGEYALISNSTGAFNTAFGKYALSSNITGVQNTSFGFNALPNSQNGSQNTAIGESALFGITSGIKNIAIGRAAGAVISGGANNQTSNNSIYIGCDTRASANGNTNEIIIGHEVIGNGSNSVTIGNSSITKTILNGNVGIGTTSTAYKLDVQNQANAFLFRLKGGASLATEIRAFVSDTAASFGTETNHPFSFFTNGSDKMTITSGGNVVVANLGTGLVYSNGGALTSTNPSDERLKDDITDIEYGLTEILQLRPVSYTWKNDTINQGKQFGFIAQEVQEVMPELIKEFDTIDEDEDVVRLGLDKEGIYAALINAIKELKVEIDLLKQ